MTTVSFSLSARASRAASKLLAAVLTAALVVSSPWVDAPKAKALASETVDYAVTFNGSTQTATAADSGTAYDGINGFTMSAWIKPAAACATGFCMIANKESSWEVGINAGVLDFAIMGATQNWDWQSIRAGSATLPRIPTGMWTHVVMAVNRAGNDLYFLVNGRLAYSLIDSTTYIPTTGRDSTDVLTIGGRPSAASFAGSIDEFRLYNTARITEALAQADMGTWGPANTANLAAYYDFNEGTGTSVVNKSSASGASTSATLNNGPTWGDIKTVDTTSARGETIVTFPRTYLTEVGGYTLPSGPTRARVLVVGGGGGGGSDNAGGGGAGGVYDSAYSATPTVAVSAGVYAVTVGQGGFGGRDMTVAPTESPATDGWATTAFGVSAGYGGAGGSGHSTAARNYGNAGGPGTAGGSGGGSANEIYAGAGGAAGTGTAFNGFAGGAGGSSDSIGSGGGGASAAGAAAGTGTGGAGKSSSISGTATTYGGGGGAGRFNGQSGTAAGGAGGGGAGTLTQGGDGSANTGGGGGGATWSSTVSRGGFGGTGLVVIRWTLPQAFATTQYALSTDATSTAIAQITDTTNSPFDNLDDFTFEAWLKPTARNTYARTLLGKEASFLVALWPSDAGNQVCFAIYVANWQWQCTSSVVPSGSWTHLAFVRTGGYIVVYLNGAYSTTTAPAGANTAGTIYSNNNPVGIGGRPAAPTDNYAGLMDEVRMWNYARSASDVSTFYQRRIAGNILYMPFDDVDMSYTAARNDGTRYVVNRAASAGTGFNAVLGTNATLGTSSIASVDSNLVGSGFQGYLPGVDLNNNGTAVTFTVSTQPTKGTVTVNRTTGFFNYVGTANNFGVDSFAYSVTGTNGTTTGTYNITLNDYAIASSKSFSQSSDITAAVGSATSLGYSNPSTQYTNGETVRAVLSSTSGTLAATLNGSTLAAGSQNSTSLTLDGTQAQINAALNSATITSSATNPARVTLTISMKPADQTVGGRSWVYNTNGHFYSKYDAGAVNLTQPQATTAANAITLGGRRAYLATIQHSGENATVQTAIGSVTAYLGGNDAAVEGTFRWYGNDTNAVFRTAGATYRNRYNNWNTGEPNDSGGNEDWVEMNGSNGIWNDCGSACIGTRQYAAIEVDPVSTRTVTNIDFSKALTATASAARNLGLGTTFLSTSLWGTTETVFATISVDSGTVSLTQGGTTVSAGALGSSTFTVEATRDTLNTALNTATVTPPASGSSSVTVSYGVKRQTTGSYYYSSASDHFYFRNTTTSAQATHATTAGTTAFGGTYGYLATVTSGEEYTTVRAISGAQSWSGGSDSVSEGQWTWDAPDAYQIFSDFDQSIGGSYQQWDPAGQPDNSGQGMVVTYGSSNSLWDDQGDTNALAAIYEWAPIDTSLTLSVTSSGALSITTPSSGLTATMGTAFSLSTGASGGLSPYTYSLGGSLPSGLSLNASSGVISGTTTVAGGSYAVTVTATDANGATATTSSFSIRATAPGCSPTSTIVGTQTVLQFSSTGYCDWTVPSGVTSVDAFVVGAGGGGGSDGGVGGGGGAVTRIDGVVATPGSSMTVQVGTGGTGGIYGGAAATAGGQSSLVTTGGTTYTVNGGSAGATGPSTTGGAGGTTTVGFAGGAGGTSSTIDGTGGGNGKTGAINYFTGTGVEYGGGGGGGIYNGGTYTIAARTGASGGGNGCAANGATNTAGSAGVRGGGGGAGCAGNAGRTVGGAGGNGIVIIRYATDPNDAFPAAIGSLRSHVTADSFQALDSTRRTWLDTTANGRSATTFYGSPTVTDITGNGASNTVKTLSGGTTTGLRFPAGFLSSGTSTADDYTMFHVARYSGATKGRIFDAVNSNWLSGFWSGNAGWAYHNMAVAPTVHANWTSNVNTHSNWVLSTDQNNAYRSNGGDVLSGSVTGASRSDDLAINYGYYYASEYSDWNVAEVLVFSRALTAAEIRRVESWLSRKYGLQGVTSSGTRTDPLAVRSLSSAKVAGQTDRLAVTWTLPQDTAGVTDINVEYKLTSDSTWTSWTHTASASLTSATITGLTAGSNYDVRVTPVDSGATNRPAASASASPWQNSTITLGTLPASPRPGTAYNITATVTSGATGTVNFKNGGTSITGCSGAVISSGTATCSWTPSASGNATITADYSGDTAYLSSSTVSSSSVTVSNAICTTSNSTTGRFQVMRITTPGVCDMSALPSGVESVDILVVGGGGGAGTNVGSGGAGGGGYHATNIAASNSSSLVATVGAGGTGGTALADATVASSQLDGGNGGNSTLTVGATTFTGTGGTGGQTHWANNTCSGTGSSWNSTAVSGVAGTGTGGSALTSGAGGQGSSTSGAAPTAGGTGYTNSITGTATYYGGGGGGGGWNVNGAAGGLGGGGAGNNGYSTTIAGSAGTDNLGGGGGSGVSCGNGGSGGSGVVIVRYAQVPTISTQPAAAAKTAAQGLTLSVSASATGASASDLSYQWRKDGSNISGATSSSLVFNSITVADAGTYSVVVKSTGTGGSAVSSVTSADAVVTVAQASQTITFNALADKTYGDAAFTVSATAQSGGTVTFASTTTGVCTVSGTTVTIVNVGTCTVTASQAGTADYTAATDVSRSFTVLQKTLTVSGTTASGKTYDRTTTATPNFGSSTLVGRVGSDDVTLVTAAGTASFADKTVGTGKTVTVAGLTLGGTTASRYTLTQPTTTASITSAALTVSGITASNKVYDGLASATSQLNTGSASLVGVIGADVVTLSTGSATGTFADKTVGTGRTVTVAGLTLGGADSGNYSLTQPTTTADITAKTLTVSGITATDKTYDRTNTATLNTGSAAFVGKVAGDTVNIDVSSAAGTFPDKLVGSSRTVTVTGVAKSGTDAGNYSITQPTTTASITAKGLTVSNVTASNRTYDGTNSATALLNLGTAALSGVITNDTVTINTASATATFASKIVGTGKQVTVAGITIGGADSGNYSLVQPSTTADITAKTLTVSGITAANKTYNASTTATLNTGSAAFVGVETGDTVTIGLGSVAGTFADKNIGTGKTVSITGVTKTGGDAGNYVITQPSTTANITVKTLTVTGITAANRTYDATTAATGLLDKSLAALSGVESGDTVTMSHASATASFGDKNIGTGKTVQVAGITISGGDSGNYTLTQPTTTANITAATLTVTGITAADKNYDGTTTASVNSSSAAFAGILGSDVVTIDTSSVTGSFSSAAFGTNKSVQIAGVGKAGTDAGNYVITQPTTTASISKYVLTVSGITAANKTYNASTAATLSTGSASLQGVQNGETVTLNTGSASGAFADKNVGTGKTVQVSGLTISGATASNYTLVQPTTTANITAKTLTVSGITATNKTYNASTTATLNTGSAAFVGVESGDTVTIELGSVAGTFADKNIGTGKTVSVTGVSKSGGDAGNYVITQPTASANITAKTLTVTGISAANRTYDATTAATSLLGTGSAALAGVESGDSVTLSTSSVSATFADKNIGTGKTVNIAGLTISGGDSGNYTLTQPTTTADITAKTLTVSGITAANKTYNASTTATLNTGSAAFVGVESGDTVTIGLGSVAGTFADKNIGSGKTVSITGVTKTGGDASNYVITQPSTTANIIAKTLTVSGITAANRTYDATDSATALLDKSLAALVGVVAGDDVSMSHASATATFADKNVGTGKTVSITGISKSGTDSGNYTLTQPTTTADITAKTLTVTGITAANKTYNASTTATLNTGSAAFVGVESGDTVTIGLGSVAGTFADKNIGSGKTVSITGVTKTGGDAGNYSITQPSTTADITAKTLTVTGITAANKTYNASTTATLNTGSAAFVGVESGDTVTIGLGSVAGTFADKNIGSGKTVSITGVSKTGGDAGNYSITQPTTTANITAKTLTVSGITAANKTYDATISATSLLNHGSSALVGVESGDTVTLVTSQIAAVFLNKNVGSAKSVVISGLTISGSDSGNYSITQPTTTADITTATLTVSGITASTRIYDGTTTATLNLSGAALVGADAGDTVTLVTSSASGAFSSAAVGAGKTVQVSGLTIAGADAGNYALTQPTTTADILTASAGLSWGTPAGITYGTNLGSSQLNATANVAGTFIYSPVAGTKLGVGSHTLSVSFTPTNAAYDPDSTTVTITVTAKTLTVSGVTATNKTYDATRTATLDTASAAFVGVVAGDDVAIGLGSVAGTFADKNIGSGKTVSITGVTKTGGDAGNYSITQPSTTADITAKTLTVSGITAANKTYNASTTATLNTGSAAFVGVESGDTVTIGLGSVAGTFADKNIGSGKTVSITGVSKTGGDAGNYVITPPSTTADITAKTLTVSGITAANKTYNASTTATLNTGSAAFVGVETGDTVTIGLGSVAGTFADKNIGSGKTVSITGVTKTGGDAGNYVITPPSTTANITAKTLTATGITAADRIYDATDSATALLDKSLAALVGVVAGDDVSMNHASATATFADKTVGSNKTVTIAGITKSGTDAGNYSLTQPSTTASITEKTLTISGITASNKTYDALTAASLNTGSAAFVGVESGDTVTIGLGSVAGTFADKNVGSGKTVNITGVSKTGGDAGNYSITQPTTTASITAKTLTVSGITAANKTYNASTTATLNTGSAAFVGIVSGDDTTIGLGSVAGTFADKNIGSGKTVSITGVTKTGGDAGNYVITQPSTTANITAKTLTVTGITAADRIYDATDSATALLDKSLATLVGVVAGDDVSMSHGSATAIFADKTVGSNKTVNITGITKSGADAGNYTLTQPTTTANITAKTLTVTGITANNKTYDALTSATLNTGPAAFVGVESGDTVTIGLGSVAGTFADKNIGSGKTVSITGVTKTGGDAGNYAITQPTTTASITAKTLTVSGISAANRVYDATVSATAMLDKTSATLMGVVVGDDVSMSHASATATFADKTVGSNKTVNIIGITKSGADAGNYTLTQPTTTASITAKTLTVSGITANNKTYNASTTASLNTGLAAFIGVESGDTVSIGLGSVAGTFADKNIGSGKTVSITGVTKTGGDAGNYSITQPSTTANITAKTLTVTGITANNKVFTGTVAATVNAGSAAFAGVESGDSVTIGTGSVAAVFDDANVGTNRTVSITGVSKSGTDAGNYVITQPFSTANITQATSGLSWTTPASIEFGTSLGSTQLGATASVAGTAVYNRASGERLDAGTHVLSVTFTPDSGNYATESASVSLVVTQRPLTVTADSVTVTYGGSVTQSFATSGLSSPDTALSVTYRYAGTGGTTYASSTSVPVNAGSYSITPSALSLSSGLLANYSVTYSNGSLQVNRATQQSLVAVATATTLTYAAPTKATTTLSTTGGDGDGSVSYAVVGGSNAVCSVSGTTLTVEGAGACQVTATKAQGTNHLSTTSAPIGITVNKAPQTVTLDAIADRTYGDGTFSATTSASSGLTVGLQAGPAGVCDIPSGHTVRILANGTCTVTASQPGNDNYLSATAAPSSSLTRSFTIARKTLTLSGVSANNRTYDGTRQATPLISGSLASASLVGVVAGDTVSLDSSATDATFATKTIGAAKAITVAGVALAGTHADRYVLTQPTGLTANVTARTVTVSGITVPTRAYDTSTTASLDVSGHSLSGVVAGDVAALDASAYTATFATAGVATGKNVTVTGLSLAGADAGNYVLTQPILQGTVVRAAATVNYNATRVTTYNGTPRALSATSTPASLVVTHSYSGNAPTVYGPTSAPPTNAGGYTVAGTIVDANYEGSATANWLVNKQTVTVSIDPSALSRTFDGNARQVSASSSPSGKNIVVDYSGTGGTPYGSTWAPTNAGTYTVTATVEEANYDGVATAVLSIARAAQPALALSNSSSMQYGTPMTLVATGGAGSGAVTFSRVSGTCAVDDSTGRVTATSAGTCAVRVERDGSTNYLPAVSATQNLTVSRATQAIAFSTEVPSMPLPDTTYSPSAASTSGLPVVVSVTAGAGSSCTYGSGTVRFLASGTCIITAGQAGDANHEAAPAVSQTIEVGRLNQTIDFPQPAVRSYGSSPALLAGSATSGLPLSFTVNSGTSSCSVAADGTLTVASVGSCAISASQPGDTSFAAATSVTRTVSVVPTRATQPFIASVSAGDAMITVGYTAPANNGGSPVVAYSLSASSPSASTVSRSDCSTVAMSCVLSGLVNGASYTVSVTAVTAAGSGESSEAVEVLVPNPTLDAPLAVVGARSSTTIDLSWDDPAAFDATTFQRYDVYLREEGGSYGSPVVVTSVDGSWSNSRAFSVISREPTDIESPARALSVSARSARFTGLNPARKYQAKVVTITSVRSVEALTNTSSALVMPFSVPDTVRELAVSAPTATTALVTWRVPASSGGTPITEYVVSSNRGPCTLVSLTATRCTVTGLSAGDSLTVSVRARNSVGDGAVSSTTYAVPTTPGTPTVNAVSASQTSASISWSSPAANGGRPVTSYAATAVNATDPTDSVRCSSFSTGCELRGMKPGTTYGVRVRAFNSVGGGSWSTMFTFDTSKTVTTDWQSFRNQNQTAKSTAQVVTALPPAPAKVSKTSVSGGSRTKVVATRRLVDASIPVTHAIISVSTTSGKLLARIKVRVDSDNPETSVTVPYASRKVKVAVQFANDYGISSGGPMGVNIAEGNTFDSTVVADQVRVVGTEVAPYTYFARGSSTLSPAAKSELKKVAAAVRQRGGLVYVSGFAARNELRSTWLVQGLARMRAETVAKYLSTLGVRQWISFAGTTAPTSPWDESRVRRAVVSTDTVINQA